MSKREYRELTGRVQESDVIAYQIRQSFYENRKQQKQPKEKWIVVENTHEPLIDRETFDKVQTLAQCRNEKCFENLGRFSHLETTENILRGLIYCAECKRPLVRYKNVSHEKKLWYTFICQTHTTDITSCPKKNIRKDMLIPMLLQAIQTQITLAADRLLCHINLLWQDVRLPMDLFVLKVLHCSHKTLLPDQF